MDNQHVLEEVVRAWVEERLPGQATIANQAVDLVGTAYESGVSVPIACRQVTNFVNARVRHPGYQRTDSGAMALLAS
jgi:hypothetical protein